MIMLLRLLLFPEAAYGQGNDSLNIVLLFYVFGYVRNLLGCINCMPCEDAINSRLGSRLVFSFPSRNPALVGIQSYPKFQ